MTHARFFPTLPFGGIDGGRPLPYVETVVAVAPDGSVLESVYAATYVDGRDLEVEISEA